MFVTYNNRTYRLERTDAAVQCAESITIGSAGVSAAAGAYMTAAGVPQFVNIGGVTYIAIRQRSRWLRWLMFVVLMVLTVVATLAVMQYVGWRSAWAVMTLIVGESVSIAAFVLISMMVGADATSEV
jgi:cellulose synthase/poly-beta-1,6-N-acetylglucosamine synthase-like glycosyltransferase